MALQGIHLDIVTQTLLNEIGSLQKQIIDKLQTGEARAQDELHALVDSVSAHLHAIDVLHGNAVASAQTLAAKAEDAKQQAVGVADQIVADVQKAVAS